MRPSDSAWEEALKTAPWQRGKRDNAALVGPRECRVHKHKKGWRQPFSFILTSYDFLSVKTRARLSCLAESALLFSTRVSPSRDPNLVLGGLRVPAPERSHSTSFWKQLHCFSHRIMLPPPRQRSLSGEYAIIEERNSGRGGTSWDFSPGVCEGINPSIVESLG